MSNINFNDLEPGSIILTESPRVPKKSPYEADREYQLYTVVATNDKQARQLSPSLLILRS